MLNRCLVVMFAIAALAGCGRPQEEKPAESAAAVQKGADQAQQGADDMAKGLQQMAQGLQQMAQSANDGKPVTPVSFEKLQTALPMVSGWERSEPEGHSMTMPAAISTTEAKYTKGDMDVTLTITDSAFSPLISAPLAMMSAAGYSERTSKGYKRATTVGGAPGYEEWDSNDKSGTIGAIVAKRFLIEASGSNLDSLDTLKGVLEKIDFKKLSALQ